MTVRWCEGTRLEAGDVFSSGTQGVFLVYSLDTRWRAAEPGMGASAIALIGAGDIGAALTRQCAGRGSPVLGALLARRDRLAFCLAEARAPVARRWAWGLRLLFQETYGMGPAGNRGTPGPLSSPLTLGERLRMEDVILGHHVECSTVRMARPSLGC